MAEPIPENTDNPIPETDNPTISSPSSEEVLKKALDELREENKRMFESMEALRKSYEQSFNRQPEKPAEHDDFDEVCQKILKGER